MYTRAHIEDYLIRRRGKVMILVGLDGITVDGTNADLTTAIGSAIRFLGGTTADPLSLIQADLDTVPSDLQPAIFEASEMYLISLLRSQITSVDQTTGPFSAKLSQLPDRLLADWLALQKKLQDEYNIGGPQAVMSVFEQNFAAHGTEDEPDV